MSIYVIGINYQTAPIHMREAAAISNERLPGALSELREYVKHGVILSTCNRTEVYTYGSNNHDLTNACEKYFKDCLHIGANSLSSYGYSMSDKELVRHLFRVSCGLDSMIIGEYEVLGQVKQAFEAADQAGMMNLALRHIFQSALSTGRRAREETGISKYALSVSSVAVKKAFSFIPGNNEAKLIIIGAGEAGREAIRVARSRAMEKIVIISRTEKRAVHLTSQCGGRPAGMDKLMDELSDADIVITCAASPHAILRYKQVSEVMKSRTGLPMVIIDIAIPRNVEPEVKSISNVHLFNIDDLNKLADKNRAQREREIDAVEKIISQETGILMKWWTIYKNRPAIKALMAKAERIRTTQYNNSMRRLSSLSEEEKESIARLTTSIVDKILRDPILYMKSIKNESNKDERINTIKELFKLDYINEDE